MAGIVPNTLSANDPVQRASHVVGNVVYDNGNANAPSLGYTFGMFGTGILVWGGDDNLIENNVVDGHPNYGIAVHPSVTEPSGHVIRGNRVGASGGADLALGASAGPDNRFDGNLFASGEPAGLQGDASGGAAGVTRVYETQRRRAENDAYPSGDLRDQPEPGDQPTMRDPEAPPRPATVASSWGE